jgi:competence protein ComFC
VRAGRVVPPPGIGACAALFRHDGVGRDLVLASKYRNRRDAMPWIGSTMAALVEEVPDLVTWAPTAPARRRGRGFDQAELLARHVARALRVPCRPSLSRLPGEAQTGRSAIERRRGVGFRSRPVGGRVLVVDDVVTTGATLAAAAAALRAAGAASVDAVVASHRR